ncbi:alpha/beta fold hydrolase [Tunturiibacter psychrotolerans]|uniref:alpha/beta fold hydrolase n=1 Tax=Tunturiibacter psychrotolerans TaxID=3069686 RepID=UPI003D25C6EB
MDPPGSGKSEPANEGYDTANVAKMLSAALNTATSERIHLVGHEWAAGSRMPGPRNFQSR